MEAYDLVLKRRSVRSYKPDPVPRELLEKVLEAGRLAPTTHNEQPWAFVVVTDADRRRRIAEITDYGKFLAPTPACIFVLCRQGRHYLEDGCAATTQMMIAARTLGLGTCWIAGDKKVYATKLASLVGAPAEFRLVALIAIGYAAEEPTPPKRPLGDLVHWETW